MVARLKSYGWILASVLALAALSACKGSRTPAPPGAASQPATTTPTTSTDRPRTARGAPEPGETPCPYCEFKKGTGSLVGVFEALDDDLCPTKKDQFPIAKYQLTFAFRDGTSKTVAIVPPASGEGAVNIGNILSTKEVDKLKSIEMRWRAKGASADGPYNQGCSSAPPDIVP
jgi:hypothetical protein